MNFYLNISYILLCITDRSVQENGFMAKYKWGDLPKSTVTLCRKVFTYAFSYSNLPGLPQPSFFTEFSHRVALKSTHCIWFLLACLWYILYIFKKWLEEALKQVSNLIFYFHNLSFWQSQTKTDASREC